MNSPWTQEEIDYLKKNYPLMGLKISEQLDRTAQAVRSKASELGLKLETRPALAGGNIADDALNIDLCKRISEVRLMLNLSYKELGKIIGKSNSYVSNMEHGLLRRMLPESVTKGQIEVATALGIPRKEINMLLTSESRANVLRGEKKEEKQEELEALKSDPHYQLEQVNKEIDYTQLEWKKAETRLAEIKKEDSDKSLSIYDRVKHRKERANERIGLESDVEFYRETISELENKRKKWEGILAKHIAEDKRTRLVESLELAQRIQKKFELQTQAIGELIEDLAMKLDGLVD